MLKGRFWRFLTLFFLIYIVFLILFLRSFKSEGSTTVTSSIRRARVIDAETNNQENLPVVKQNKHEANLIETGEKIGDINDNNNVQLSLEPIMTTGVLGNYEPRYPVKNSGLGEDGEGVQLTDENERKLGEQSVQEYGFNEVASDKISLDRRARDTRLDNNH